MGVPRASGCPRVGADLALAGAAGAAHAGAAGDSRAGRPMNPRGALLSVASFVATGAALALFAMIVAWWGWRWLGPRPVTVTPATPHDPAAAILASGLWRSPGAAPSPAPRSEEVATLSGDTRLLGVLAEHDGRGYALFRLPGGPRLVAVGQDIAQGASLVAVQPDSITIREGRRERHIELRAASTARAAAPAAVAAARPARNPACAPPPGFKGAVLKLNAELFQGIIAKPEAWTSLLAADRGALSVRDDSGFSAMLAMRKGDRLMQANGIALTAPQDVVSAVLRPLAAQQQVRVIGQRNGQPREWLLLNAGTCSP